MNLIGKLVIIGIIMGILIAVLAFISFTEEPIIPGGANSTPRSTPMTTPITTQSKTTITTSIGLGTMFTTMPQPGTSAPTNIIPPSFSLSITPIATSAQRGEKITYTTDIIPSGGFDSPIYMDITVTALFFHQDYDLGTQYPPYPKRILYDFQVPGYIPPGTALVGVMRAEGGGVTREEGLTLTVI